MLPERSAGATLLKHNVEIKYERKTNEEYVMKGNRKRRSARVTDLLRHGRKSAQI